MAPDPSLAEYAPRIEDIVVAGCDFIYRAGEEHGDWLGDPRATSMAISTLLLLGKDASSRWIREPSRHLAKMAKPSNRVDGGEPSCWSEEVWDTSLAMIALNRGERKRHEGLLKRSELWLAELWHLNRRSWHDDPWETALALRTMAEVRCPQLEEIAVPAVRWYLGLQDSGGRIVNSCYTAFLLNIFCDFRKGRLCADPPSGFGEEISAGADLAFKYLTNDFCTQNAELWTNESWSNGYVLEAVAQYPKFDSGVMLGIIGPVVDWFYERIANKPDQEGVEDVCAAVTGLFYLHKQISKFSSGQDIQPIHKVVADKVVKRSIKTHCFRVDEGDILISITRRFQKRAALAVTVIGLVLAIWGFADKIRALLGWIWSWLRSSAG